MTMLNLFFSHDGDDDTFQTGEIVRAVGPDHYLVKIDIITGNPTLALQLVSVAEMTDTRSRWRFCETRAELDAYIVWMTTPPPPLPEEQEVLSLAARRKRH